MSTTIDRLWYIRGVLERSFNEQAGVAQWQSARLVSEWPSVQVRSSATVSLHFRGLFAFFVRKQKRLIKPGVNCQIVTIVFFITLNFSQGMQKGLVLAIFDN